jgi:hypothetical protein
MLHFLPILSATTHQCANRQQGNYEARANVAEMISITIAVLLEFEASVLTLWGK